jgi:uncharacterized repeat protein (TIGR02543 family)
MWYADNASTSDRNYAVLTFSEPHTLTGINILALQDSKPYSIPDDALTSSNVRKKYTVYNKAEDGSWTQIAALDTSLDQKVLSRITFDQEVTTQEIKVEVTTTYALRLTEIEPIESRTYTVNDVKKVEKETEIDVESLTNYALAANGGTIKASQTYDGKADYCIDGEISGNKDENGKQRRWRINNKEASLTIELAEEREIYCVDLISQQKDLTAGESQYQEPTLETITDLGIKKATISYQTASSSNWESYATLDSDGTNVWNRFKVKKPVRAKAFKIDFPKDAGNKSYVRVIEVQILGTEIKDPDDETTDNDSSGSNEETKLYNLKIQNGYLVKVNDTDMDEAESAEVKEKDHIIAESMEPGEDEEFKEWRVLLGSPDIKIASGSNASRVEFDMPAEDVTLQAEYQKKDTGETDTTTPSTPEVDFTSDPTGWAYAEDAALKKLLENDDILTSADQDILNAGGDISIILNLKRTDISSSDALGRKLLEIWSDEDDKQIAFLGQNRLTKTRPVTEKSRSNLASRANAKRRSSTETVELTGVTQEVEIIAGIPDKWQGMDQNDYQLILYSKDENEEYQLLLQNFEWVTDRTIRFTADVNADYMMMVPVFYTVTFKDYDGTVLGTCKVKAGEAAEAPSKIPEREGYVFTGWNKEYSQVTKDLTVTAKYRRSELVKGVADTLKNILAALEDLGGSLMEMQSEIAYQLKRIQALDMKAHIEKSEIQSLLDEIETVVEGLTGDTIYVENLTGIIDDMQASWALFSVACGEGGRLQVTRTQTPSETPASAGTLGTKLAFKIRLFEGQNLKTDLKTWMKLTMTVPDGLDEDDDLVVIFYPDGSTTGKVLSCDISSGEITMLLKQCGTIVVADKGRKADEEETEDPEMSETPDISEEPETPDTTEETPDTTEETTEQPETTETPDTVEEPETTDTTETTEKTETTKNNRYSSDDDDDDDDDISSGLSSGRRTSSVQEVSGSWKQDEKGWWFAKKTGSYCKSEWAQINGSWYHFDSDGYAETGWCLDNGKWYYLGSSCAMQTGWLTDSLDGNRYYLDPVTGEMIVGWIQIDGKWYYFEENTPSASGWTWNETGKYWQYQQNGSHPRGAYVEGKTR